MMVVRGNRRTHSAVVGVKSSALDRPMVKKVMMGEEGCGRRASGGH